jgi:hypothetical protein
MNRISATLMTCIVGLATAGLSCAGTVHSTPGAAGSATPAATEQRGADQIMREAKHEDAAQDAQVKFSLSESESKSFSVSSAPSIVIENFNGPVAVRAWDKAEVSFNAVKRALDHAALQDVRVQASQSGRQLAISVKFTGPARKLKFGRSEVVSQGAYVELEVNVPQNADLRITNDDGPLRVSGVKGEVNLRTGDGAISVRDGRGRLSAYTNDGLVEIVNYNGAVDASEMGDHGITLDGEFTQLKALTGGGPISLSLPAGFNATVVTDAESVVNKGMNAAAEAGSAAGLKRWRIGNGGTVFDLRPQSGKLILRRAGSSED